MSALVLTLALVAGGTDSLAKVSIDKLSFKAPTQWTASSDDASTKSWASPDGAADFSVSAFPVDPVRPADACVNEMLEKLGKEGFEKTKLGGQSAQKKVTTDYVGEGEDAGRSDENKVTTTTVIGCNGKVRWVMTWSARANQATRFGPMLKRVLDSITYGK